MSQITDKIDEINAGLDSAITALIEMLHAMPGEISAKESASLARAKASIERSAQRSILQ